MKKIIILLCLILGSFLYSYKMIDNTVHAKNSFIKERPVQTNTIKKPFIIDNFLIKPLYEYEIKGVILETREVNSDKKEAQISDIDIVLGWQELSKQEYIDKIDLNLNYRWFSWKNSSLLSDKIVNLNISNNHIIHSDSIIKKQLSKLKKGQAVSMSGYLVRVLDNQDSNWGWRSSVSRTDKEAGSSEVFYVNYIELIN